MRTLKRKIESAKKKLIKQAEKKGICENFGQEEVSKLKNDISDLQLSDYQYWLIQQQKIDDFADWCATFGFGNI